MIRYSQNKMPKKKLRKGCISKKFSEFENTELKPKNENNN